MKQENINLLIKIAEEIEGLKVSFACEDVTQSSQEEFDEEANSALAKLNKIIEEEMTYMNLDDLVSYCKVLLSTGNARENVATFLKNLHISFLNESGEEEYYNSLYTLLKKNQVIGEYTFYFTNFQDNELLMAVHEDDYDAKVIERKLELKSSLTTLLSENLDKSKMYKFVSSEEASDLK